MKNFFKELLDELMSHLRLMFKHTTVQGNIRINIPTNYNLPISPSKKVKRKTKRVITTVAS